MEKVVDKVMYHFHKPYVERDKWKVNNEIIVDNNYNSYFIYNCLYNNPVGIPNVLGRMDSYLNAVKAVVSSATDEEMLRLKENEEEYLEKIRYVKSLLNKSIEIAHGTAITNRELGLEDYRQEYHPDLPSRLHSMWVCDAWQVDYWKRTLDIECELYLLSLTGNLFRTSAMYLPSMNVDRRTAKVLAANYWEPPQNLDGIVNAYKDEYLFQGKAKILKKVFM